MKITNLQLWKKARELEKMIEGSTIHLTTNTMNAVGFEIEEMWVNRILISMPQDLVKIGVKEEIIKQLPFHIFP